MTCWTAFGPRALGFARDLTSLWKVWSRITKYYNVIDNVQFCVLYFSIQFLSDVLENNSFLMFKISQFLIGRGRTQTQTNQKAYAQRFLKNYSNTV